MQLLAIDTSTDTMSVAVGRADATHGPVWTHTGAGGAQASAALLPVVQTLLARAGLGFGDLDAIAFGRGPGAFTGLRTACAVAQGLAFGARRPSGRSPTQVLPVDSLLAVAEQARAAMAVPGDGLRVLAVLDARMDEVYSAAYRHDGRRWHQDADTCVGVPERLELPAAWLPGPDLVLAGNAFAQHGARLPAALAGLPRIEALPTAEALLRLAVELLDQGRAVSPDDALPLYVRDKVASTTAERAAQSR